MFSRFAKLAAKRRIRTMFVAEELSRLPVFASPAPSGASGPALSPLGGTKTPHMVDCGPSKATRYLIAWLHLIGGSWVMWGLEDLRYSRTY
jgi:hypothetical protein